MNPRALIVASLAAAALAGLAMAAEGQEESFLKPADLESGFSRTSLVSGSLVALTALLVAACCTAFAGLLATCRVRDRLVPLMAVFVGTYVVVSMMQTAMFNYHAIDIARFAQFAVSLVIANEPASPSVYIGPMAFLIGAGLVIQAAARRLMGRADAPRDVSAALPAFIGALIIAFPALVVLAVGSIRVLLALPDEDPATLAYLIVLPLSALAGLALIVIGSIKAWHLGLVARDRRLAPVAREAWEGLRRAEWAAVATLLALALLASIMKPVQDPILEAGRVFGVTARTHTQFQVLLPILLVPWFTLQRPIMEALRTGGNGGHANLRGGHPLVIGFWIAGGAGLVGAVLATWLLGGALWPWLFCSLPLTIYALSALRAQDSLLPALTTAAILWAIGNTIGGSFQLTTNSQLRYEVSPGMLALWRAMAILLAAWAVARAARAQAAGLRQAIAWPLTMGLAGSIGIIIFFELSLSAWIIRDGGAEYVAIGTLMASLDPPVRAVLHVMAGMGAFLSGLAIARLERPDWFGRATPQPTPMPPLPTE